MPFPCPWIPTGRGSYRELRPGVYEITWRPEGKRGPKHKRRVTWPLEDVLAFFAGQAENRQRRGMGVRERSEWTAALEHYRARLAAKGNTPGYLAEALRLLEGLRTHARVPLDRLTAAHVQAWADAHAARMRQALNARGQPRYPGWASTLNRHLAILRPFFRRQRHRMPDPMAEVEPFRQTVRLRRLPDPSDYARLWAICEPPLQDLLDWLLLTGCRFGEAARARRVDVSSGVWFIPHRKGRNDHAVPLPALLAEIFLRQPQRPDGLIFHRWTRPVPEVAFHPFGSGEPITVPWLRKCLIVRCGKAGIRYFSAHGLRHAAVDWSDADARKVQGLVGHSSIQTTERYMHGFKLGGSKVVQAILQQRRDDAIKSLRENA